MKLTKPNPAVSGLLTGVMLTLLINGIAAAALNINSQKVDPVRAIELSDETIPARTEPPTEPPEPTEPTEDYRNHTGIDPEKPMVALTYDDGPLYESTTRVLDTLESYGVHATFFVVGEMVDEETGPLLERARSIGCEIGNHTWEHENLSTQSLNAAVDALGAADKAISTYTGEKPIYVRPPYGAYNDAILEADGRMFIYWSVDTRDWDHRTPALTYSNIMDNVTDGDIILMHDIYGTTADATEEVVPALLSEGYQLVTISELIKYRDFQYENSTVLFNLHPDEPLYTRLETATESETDATEESRGDADQEDATETGASEPTEDTET